mgnify:CR=1 FL=1
MPRSPSYVVRGYAGDRDRSARLLWEMGPYATLTAAKKAAQPQADASRRGVKVYVEPVGTEEVDPTHPRDNPAAGSFCGPGCRDHFEADHARGVQHPPVELAPGQVVPWVHGSRQGRFCAHCGADLSQPRQNPEEEEAPVLPDAPWRYFKAVPGAVLLDVAQLVPIRARVTGIANAARYMRAAYDGTMERRKPISVARRPDGLYSVCDGNSTFANAKRSGWSHIVAVVTDRCEVEAHPNPHNPAVSSHSDITERNYPAIFGASPRGIPEVDDPFGHHECEGEECGDQIEETRLSDQFRTILHTRDAYLPRMKHVMELLRDLAPSAKVLGRVKTPYSLIQKLVRSFVAQPGPDGVGKFKTARGTESAEMPLGVPLQLKDMAGTKIVAKDRAELDAVRDAMLAAFRGHILEYEDKYAEEERNAAAGRPRLGYNAYHMVVLDKGLPVEIIMQTERIEKLGHASHGPYKNKRLNFPAYIALVDLVNRADLGDRAAARQIDPRLATEAGLHDLEREITSAHVNPGQLRANPTDPDVIAEVSDPDGWAA